MVAAACFSGRAPNLWKRARLGSVRRRLAPYPFWALSLRATGNSWCQRRRIGDQCDHVAAPKVFDSRLHRTAIGAVPRARFEVIKLTEHVLRRAAGESRRRGSALEVRAMTACALD